MTVIAGLYLNVDYRPVLKTYCKTHTRAELGLGPLG